MFKMKYLIGILMMITIISKNNARQYNWEESDETSEESSEQAIKRFNSFFDERSFDDNEDIFAKRDEPIKLSKCTEIIANGYPRGQDLATIPNILNTTDCMTKCDENGTCLSWAYSNSRQTCWLQSSSGSTISDNNFQGGSCIEPKTKVRCEQIVDYQYSAGSRISPDRTAYTIFDCMKMCDDNSECLAWYYKLGFRSCSLLSSVGEFEAEPESLTGTCERYRNSKCKEKRSGVSYYGNYSQPDIVNTSEACINICEKDSVCTAWSFENSTKNCYRYTFVTSKVSNPAYTSGQCYRGDLKAKDCENKRGYPADGDYMEKSNIRTQQDCRTKCDNDMRCWGWTFASASNKCSHYSTVIGFSSVDGYVGGNCYVSNPPYRNEISLGTFRQQMLNKHNDYRRNHCVSNLKLTDKLNDISQDYAERLAGMGKSPARHSGFRMDNVYSQSLDYNLYGSVPVDTWYNEIQMFNWDYPDFMELNSFAKVIWSGTLELGVGRAVSRNNRTMFVVATYSPFDDVADSYRTKLRRTC